MSAAKSSSFLSPKPLRAWSCPQCGTEDASLRYQSGKIAKCRDCQRFYNLTVNAAKVRKHGKTPRLDLSLVDFLAWARSPERARACHYCRIPEAELPNLGLRSSIGLPVEALGIDRLDNERDYVPGNIAWCCYGCNKVKGNVFSEVEMLQIGAAVESVWRARLGSASRES